MRVWPRRWNAHHDHPLAGRPSALGLVLGALCFALSLTPSMIPRAALLQGALGGVCFAAGYLIGHVLVVIYAWVLERSPPPRARQLRRLAIAAGVGGVIVIWALLQVTGWQNGINEVMGIAPVESARPLTILWVALAVAIVLILIGRVFRRSWRLLAAQIEAFMPRRLAVALGLTLACGLFWAVGSGVLLDGALRALDRSYAAVDAILPPDRARPSDPLKSGSEASLISWESLGAAGRDWVAMAPDQAQLKQLWGEDAMEPLRIFVGLNSARTAEERAGLVLAEAIRVGAFERSYLVIATPTGTGWMDPAGMQPLDMLTRGDVATLAVQYSYLPSWLSLFVQPQLGDEQARAVFRVVHDYWRALPVETRPKLYLFGLSLGAMNGQSAVALTELLADPPQGALWVGPPFSSSNWRQILSERNAGSLTWAPRIGDGSIIRSMTAELPPDHGDVEPWGRVRMLFLAYGSDPIVWFTPAVFWQRPAWAIEERAPDVSPGLHWFPVVSFLQLAFDMMTATTTPVGHGHVYAGRDYLTAWAEVLDLADLPAARRDAMRAILDEQHI